MKKKSNKAAATAMACLLAVIITCIACRMANPPETIIIDPPMTTMSTVGHHR